MASIVSALISTARRFLPLAAIAAALPLAVTLQSFTASAQHSASPSKDYGGMLHATASGPSFEVASIRPSGPNAERRFSGITMHPNRIEITGTSIKEVIEFAYAVPDENEFSGGPSWIRTDKFDIIARPSEPQAVLLAKLSSDDLHTQIRLMLQSLLQDRFHLRVTFPMKSLPLFSLVTANGGFKCRQAAPHGKDGPPPPPPPDEVPPPGRELWREQEMHWAAHQLSFELIVAWIASQPELGGRTVVDKTGLNGVFSCEVSWAHEGADIPGPSFFTAIKEQMGLKLQPIHGQVETIVVDHIEQPSKN